MVELGNLIYPTRFSDSRYLKFTEKNEKKECISESTWKSIGPKKIFPTFGKIKKRRLLLKAISSHLYVNNFLLTPNINLKIKHLT